MLPQGMSHQPNNICAGTQIVSLIEIRGTNNALVHPRGAVGVITRTPAGDEKHFLVRFPDGFESSLQADQIEILKHSKDRLGAAEQECVEPSNDLSPDPQPQPGFEKNEALLPMTREELEVHELLRSFATEHLKFHDYYRGALDALSSNSSDRIAQAAHSIRELCDKLPDCVGEIPKFKSPVSPVKSLQQDFLETRRNHYTDGWNNKTISKPLVRLLERLEDIFKLFNEPPRSARLRLALTSSDPHAELISKEARQARDEVFEEIGRTFQDVAHHNRILSEAQFRKELRRFESLLFNYLAPCTAAQQTELVSLIAQQPSPEALARINELISYKGANFAFFFEKLDNPNWLKTLDECGYFSDLPGPEKMPDGRIKYAFHVPLVSLTKLATRAPQEVTRILTKLELPENPRVADQVIQCMANIGDPACIKQLTPVVEKLNDRAGFIDWLWIRELLASWKAAGAIPEALSILGAYLNSVATSSSSPFVDSDTWLLKEVDKNFLEQLTVDRPFETAKIVFRALCTWMDRESTKYGESELREAGPFSYWLSDFKSPPPEHRGAEGMLAIRLYAAAEQIYLKEKAAVIEELDRLLRSNPWHLFRRLRWQLYADFPAITLENARAEVLQRIPFLKEIDYERGGHDYEFAQLLIMHVKRHNNAFLSADDVKLFFEKVLQGPVHNDGSPVEGDKGRFLRHQLWPILPLLQGEQLKSYRAIVTDDGRMTVETYKPYEPGKVLGGEVVSVAPPEADNLPTMGREQLWTYLNTWEPTSKFPTSGRWEQENIFALASKFAEFVSKASDQFQPESKWWENIKRHEILDKLLDSAEVQAEKKQNADQTHAGAPSENDWANWFGIATWVMKNPWPRESVSRFLRKALEPSSPTPENYFEVIPGLLRQLIEEDDPRLGGNGNSFRDWFTTAINSTRGDALETLLKLALRQKESGKEPEPWIFELIRSRLDSTNESPAIFAVCGARLRLITHLFSQELKQYPDLIFPRNRPEQRSAAITAHFTYDQPWVLLMQTFPDLVDIGLDVFEVTFAKTEEEEAKQNRDFGARFGVHIALYYWAGSFPDETAADRALDRFFSIAPKNTRASVIGQIASMWEKQSDVAPDKTIVRRVMRIWERRFTQIQKTLKTSNDVTASEFDNELAESLDWLNCECFPFEWRFSHAKSSMEAMKSAPQAFRLLEVISELANVPERLDPMLKLLRALLKRPGDQFRWSIRYKNLAPMISHGLSNESPATKKLADECRDMLLKRGFSEFLTLG